MRKLMVPLLIIVLFLIGFIMIGIGDASQATTILREGEADTTIVCETFEMFSIKEYANDDTLLYYKFPYIRLICDTTIVKVVEKCHKEPTVFFGPTTPRYECKRKGLGLWAPWEPRPSHAYCDHPECKPATSAYECRKPFRERHPLNGEGVGFQPTHPVDSCYHPECAPEPKPVKWKCQWGWTVIPASGFCFHLECQPKPCKCCGGEK